MSDHRSDIARYRRWYSGQEKRWERTPFPRFRLFPAIPRSHPIYAVIAVACDLWALRLSSSLPGWIGFVSAFIWSLLFLAHLEVLLVWFRRRKDHKELSEVR